MSESAITSVIERWHQHVRGALPGGLDALLDDDVVFYSPIVFTPQVGKAVTTMYLQAALQTLGGGHLGADGTGPTGFRYTKQALSQDTAMLEFETTLDGKYVNGIDIIRCNEAGRIVEFRVMIRPLQAVNSVHRAMGEMLQSLG